MDYTSYEPVEPCVLPEGAKEAAETVDSTITEEEIKKALLRQVSRHQQAAPSRRRRKLRRISWSCENRSKEQAGAGHSGEARPAFPLV